MRQNQRKAEPTPDDENRFQSRNRIVPLPKDYSHRFAPWRPGLARVFLIFSDVCMSFLSLNFHWLCKFNLEIQTVWYHIRHN